MSGFILVQNSMNAFQVLPSLIVLSTMCFHLAKTSGEPGEMPAFHPCTVTLLEALGSPSWPLMN